MCMRDMYGRLCRMESTHVCALCCGFVVPVAGAGLGVRRSMRVRERRGRGEGGGFVMLDARGRLSGFRVNRWGFESRVVRR